MQPDQAPEYVVATYEEIRLRFGLGGTDQARIKAKRRKWEHEPPNHPGAVARIRVPRKDWDAAPAERERSSRNDPDRSPRSDPDQTRTIKALEGELASVREERDRDRIRAATAEGEAKRLEEERDRLLREREAAQDDTAKLREEREEARIRAAKAEAALEELRRPFWRRWIG